MHNWQYIPEVGAYVDLCYPPEQLLGHPALMRYLDPVAGLEVSKTSVKDNPEQMQRHLNTLMALL